MGCLILVFGYEITPLSCVVLYTCFPSFYASLCVDKGFGYAWILVWACELYFESQKMFGCDASFRVFCVICFMCV